MRLKGLALIAAFSFAVAWEGPVLGQTTRASSPAKASSLPRTPDGHPDLQGTYDLATLTSLERAADQPLVLTDDDAAKLEKQVADRKFSAGLPSRGDRDAPPAGSLDRLARFSVMRTLEAEGVADLRGAWTVAGERTAEEALR